MVLKICSLPARGTYTPTQESSEPGCGPPNVNALPVEGSLGPSYSFFAASIFSCVRQFSLSPSLHRVTCGSKSHWKGCAIMPSLRPSSSSQAATAALYSTGISAACKMAFPSAPVFERACQPWKKLFCTEKFIAGAPAMMPSKSSG